MTWQDYIAVEKEKPYFKALNHFVHQEEAHKIILPPKGKRLTAFDLTPLQAVKVVIIGQDPYHNMNQAHGLAFSVETGAWPPSLKNIFAELQADLGVDVPKTGNLSAWAKQGVLLLNTILTVEIHQPLSHQNKGWEVFTRGAIELICKQDQPIVFILWGSKAQSFRELIQNPRHLVIASSHPSPLSVYRGFFGSCLL